MVGRHRLLACVVPKHCIPNCFFSYGYHWLSLLITSHSETEESIHFLHQPGKKGYVKLKRQGFLFSPEQSGHADSASDNLFRNLMAIPVQDEPPTLQLPLSHLLH